ncbi:MAG TPA: glucans biosynthesis glucosyltransferase MdoH [Verrucomicrobiae bacterium]|nr:glucans biosynthesis glucosyltransferase MdoH [Verrucomicrobiae bacterium]
MTALSLVPLTPFQRAWRIFLFYSLTVLTTGTVSALFADLLWRTGWTGSRTILLACFVVLFFFCALGFWHGVVGFIIRRFERPLPPLPPLPIAQDVSIALVFPVYNEDISRVCEGLRVTYESLRQTGQLEHFDFFILSDSTKPEKWIDEERQWHELAQRCGALGRIYYRRRINNEGKKSGNIREFLNAWGRRYRYFVIFDADSVMAGSTLVELTRLMESHGGVGLIQTVPGIVNGESLFGRMQQFANRFYAPIFLRGLDYWSRGFSNYWGHNAIIRTESFMKWCALPQLPGRHPFGGHILSHDFVEAALLARENSQVWLAYDLPGSYEEAPQAMIENAQRDRRWCQGNLQHSMLLFARGFRGVSRFHLLLGIFGYLTSPIWLAFLVAFFWMWAAGKTTGLSRITVHSWMSPLNLTASQHALLVFGICMAALLIPRGLAVLDAALDARRRRAYGGVVRITASTLGETLFSTLHAPLQMLWHTRFVITILLGQGSDWAAQDRSADGTSWKQALRTQWWQTAVGLAWGWLTWWLAPNAFWWFLPLFCGMALAVPMSVWTSRKSLGALFYRLGLFLTPEETSPPAELKTLREATAGPPKTPPAKLEESVLDPYTNAIHVSLLREAKLQPEAARALAEMGVGQPQTRLLAESVLANGFAGLPPADQKRVLSDADAMSWLHRQLWLRPESTVAPSWREAMRKYAQA